MTDSSSDRLARAQARVGTVLRGKYRLDRVLGVGGMAVVYGATHRNQARFAVKILHPELSILEPVRARFLREGYAANSVGHPGAVLVVDDDVADDGAAFLVMELLDGVACDVLWRRSGSRLAPGLATAILIQLLEVLAAAHAKAIVHRDVKPANLFLTRRGAVKVLDFGIARAREALAADEHATETGVALGTPAFMAPEQAAGNAREVDGRADLWAAAATFFFLVSGERVHAVEPGQSVLVAAATQPARSLATVAPELPASLVAIVDRALAFRKEDRWASAEAMRDALRKALPAASVSPEEVVAASVMTCDDAEPDEAMRAALHAAETVRSTLGGGAGSIAEKGRGAGRRRGIAWIAGAVVAIAVGSVVALRPTGSGSASGSASASGSGSGSGSASASASAMPVVAMDAGASPLDAGSPAMPRLASPQIARPPKPAPRPPAPDCDPNFTLDDQGRKHFKPECFLRQP